MVPKAYMVLLIIVHVCNVYVTSNKLEDIIIKVKIVLSISYFENVMIHMVNEFYHLHT
jgi:hypothetical protein